MPAKTSAKIEVIMPDSISKKHSVKFETSEEGVAFNNLYVKQTALRELGNPRAIKVTIEAHDQES